MGYFGIVCNSKIECYGTCTSIRVWYQDENEIEFGIVDPSWISLTLDSGTRKVLTEGCIRSSLIRNIIVKIYHFKKYIFFCKKYLRKLCIYYIILRQLVPQPSGKAIDCNSVIIGSNPIGTSIIVGIVAKQADATDLKSVGS